MPKPKIIAFDLETSNLNANFGYILCAGWKILGEKKVNLIKISDYPLFKKDPTNDYEVVKKLKEVLEDADGWLTWFGQYFDVPYTDSRLLHHGLTPLPQMTRSTHIDGWRIAKTKLKLNSNRLQSVCEFLQLENKTPVSGPYWVKAMSGDKKALKYVYDHCIQDIVVLEQAYEKLAPFCNWHFNVNLVDGEADNCPRCGAEDSLQKRGFSYAQATKKQRLQCVVCGSWSASKPMPVKKLKVRSMV